MTKLPPLSAPRFMALACMLLALFSGTVNGAGSSEQLFAKINERTITYGEFMQIFRSAVRHKYYHGKVPQQELELFQRKVGKDLVEQELIYQQALKMRLEPNNEKIQQGIDEYDQKYRDTPEWQAQREKAMPLLLRQLQRKDLLEQVERNVKNIKQPESKAVYQYYQANSEKFTEPKRVWVSVILLPVPPSGSSKAWEGAKQEAERLIKQIRSGESFAAIARERSSHPSAVNGGDLGYLHSGMLEDSARDAVAKLSLNGVSDPVRVLEGYTIFRLNGIQPEKLRLYDEVSNRAKDLLYRDLQDEAWNAYLTRLVTEAKIYVNEKLYASADES